MGDPGAREATRASAGLLLGLSWSRKGLPLCISGGDESWMCAVHQEQAALGPAALLPSQRTRHALSPSPRRLVIGRRDREQGT